MSACRDTLQLTQSILLRNYRDVFKTAEKWSKSSYYLVFIIYLYRNMKEFSYFNFSHNETGFGSKSGYV